MQDNLYILRYSLPVEPIDAQETRLADLKNFCRQASIDEVMFFIMPEEYNRGQWDEKDYRSWLDLAVRGKDMVEAMGLTVSLNPWITLLHCSRGRRSEHLKYRRLVSDTGQTSKAVACHLCPDWQAIFIKTFTDFAKAGFKTIWVEDDFRFHNHDEGWGGCFCDEHIRVLHERGAKAKTREELITNLNAPGRVHPDRLLWMDLNRETYVAMARQVRQAMDSVDPSIQLGLMGSIIPIHALEGRDWAKLIEAMGGAHRVPVRPHGGSYQEAIREGIIVGSANISATLTSLPTGTKTYFELENCPMSAYAKSNHLTAAQMALSLHNGCDGLTLDVLDFLGSGSDSEPGMAQTLAANRDKLDAIRKTVRDTHPAGIVCLLPEATTQRAPGTGQPDIHALPMSDYGWYTYLQTYGWPATELVVRDSFAPKPQALYALSGNAAWGLTDSQLKELTGQCTLLVDAAAADIILKRGYGQSIGIDSLTVWTHDKHPFSIERQIKRQVGEVPKQAGVNIVPDKWPLTTHQLNAMAQGQTEILDCFLQPLGTGSFLYKNSTNGQGFVLPMNLPLSSVLHGWQRKHWLDEALIALRADTQMPYLPESPWFYSDYRVGTGCASLFIHNTHLEVHETISVVLPETLTNCQVTARSRNRPVVLNQNGRHVAVTTELAGGDWLVLRLS